MNVVNSGEVHSDTLTTHHHRLFATVGLGLAPGQLQLLAVSDEECVFALLGSLSAFGNAAGVSKAFSSSQLAWSVFAVLSADASNLGASSLALNKLAARESWATVPESSVVFLVCAVAFTVAFNLSASGYSDAVAAVLFAFSNTAGNHCVVPSAEAAETLLAARVVSA